MIKYCSAKDINRLVQQLIREGWIYRRGKKHGRLRSPSGFPTLTVPTSPSDSRAFMNFKREVSRAIRE
ncbi:MAG: hypothetical protein GQ569_10590 [Methylococcaceae bacterium]|nr:hypothetical protein [Methylococcaceae bacterium]